MKPLSQSLEELAARVKVLEDSATATFEADRAKLEKRRHEIDEAFKTEVSEFDSAVREAAASRPHVVERHQGVDEAPARRGPRPHRQAPVRARAASGAAHCRTRPRKTPPRPSRSRTYFLNVAEYAVIDAALARMAADDLAAAPAPTVGATS